MRASQKGTVVLLGTTESAMALRKALLAARGCMPDGDDRDEIIGFAVHLRYAVEDEEQQAQQTGDDHE